MSKKNKSTRKCMSKKPKIDLTKMNVFVISTLNPAFLVGFILVFLPQLFLLISSSDNCRRPKLFSFFSSCW